MTEYIINTQHRDKNPNKSQWCIAELEEINLFRLSFGNEWFDENKTSCFGIISEEKKLKVLGISASNRLPLMDLHFARFVCDQQIWHGYPFGNTSSDLKKISRSILDDWKDQGYINNAVKNKINKGRYPL